MIARAMRVLLPALLCAACSAPGSEQGADAELPAAGTTTRALRDSANRERNVGSAASGGSARPSQAGAERTDREACVIAAVSDGDSIRCEEQGRVRLLLLDAPEMDQVPFGARSRDALRKRLARGDTVWLEFDVQRLDRYDRTLAHVWSAASGGTHVNLAHARDGWAVAVVFPPNVRHIEAMRAAVADARRNRRGLWADGRFTCEPIAHKRGDC
jgi:micrococcal nuclease